MPICRGMPGVGGVLPRAERPFCLTLVALPELRPEYRVR